ncbi:MAG: OsmC family protein [Mycobacterium sp.]
MRGGATAPLTVSARVEVAGASGIRRIHIREHTVISDSSTDYAGFDLGPTSPELQLGVLGSCLAHTLLIHAAAWDVVLDTVDVQVSAQLDPRGGIDGFDDAPKQPTDLRYLLRVTSPEPAETIERLVAHVDAVCPVLNLLRAPTEIRGELDLVASGAVA